MRIVSTSDIETGSSKKKRNPINPKTKAPILDGKKKKKPSKNKKTKTKEKSSSVLDLFRPTNKTPAFMLFPSLTESILEKKNESSEMKETPLESVWTEDRSRFYTVAIGVAKNTLAIFLIILLSLYIRWTFVYPFPYCGTLVKDKDKAVGAAALKWMNSYCRKCPSNGTCKDGVLKCNYGYRPGYNLFLGQRCVIDKEIISVEQKMTKEITKCLGQFVANKIWNGENPKTASMPVKQLKTLIQSKFKNMKQEKFEETFETALKKSDIVKVDGDERNISLRVPYTPLKHRIYFGLVDTYSDHKHHFFGVAFGILLVLFIWNGFKVSTRRETEDMALYEKIIGLIITQEKENRKNPSHPKALSIQQTRDLLIPDGGGSRTMKNRSWEAALKKVRANSNVREKITTIQGEKKRAWEWIGMTIN